MKKFIVEYATYNYWANEKLGETIAMLSREQVETKVESSFGSIRKTVVHLWQAQCIWINRLQAVRGLIPPEDFAGEVHELLSGWKDSSARLIDLAESQDEESLQAEKRYFTLAGKMVTSNIYQVFAHIFNHGTYHRGQLITQLRQVGVTDLPATDLIFFYREVHDREPR